MLDSLPRAGTGRARADEEQADSPEVVSTADDRRRRQMLAFGTLVTGLLLIRRGSVDVEFEPEVDVEIDVEIENGK
jgi:hypothetical protein